MRIVHNTCKHCNAPFTARKSETFCSGKCRHIHDSQKDRITSPAMVQPDL